MRVAATPDPSADMAESVPHEQAGAVASVAASFIAGVWDFKDRYGLLIVIALGAAAWWYYNCTPVYTPPPIKSQTDWEDGRRKALDKRQSALQEGAQDALRRTESERQRDVDRKAERIALDAKRMGIKSGRKLGSTPEALTAAALRRDPAANRLGRQD